MRAIWWAVLWCLWAGVAHAGKAVVDGGAQKAFDVQKGAQTWDFDVTWKDATGKHQVAFSLPAGAMAADSDERTWLPRKELNEHVAKAVRQYGKTLPDVKLKAKVQGGAVHVEASGPKGDAKKALKAAEDVQFEATDAWLAANGFTRLDDDSLTFDHARLASEYADAVAPLAVALQAGTSGEREYVDRALSFVQAIPYEARKKKGGDPGYRRPLALLSRNRGDCDSKAVLFLALVHNRYPDVPLSVVYVPGHALTGVGLDKVKGDKTFKEDGVAFLYAEPVGPAAVPLGQAGDGNEKAGKKGEVHVVP